MEQNKSVLWFLHKFVTSETIRDRQYVCKPCFAQIEKARKSLDHAEKAINSIRAKWCQNSSPIVLVSVDNTPMRPSTRVPTSSDTGLQAPMEVASGNSPVDAGTHTRPKTKQRRVSASVSTNSPVIKVLHYSIYPLSVYVMEYISQNHRLLCQKQARKDLFENSV